MKCQLRVQVTRHKRMLSKQMRDVYTLGKFSYKLTEFPCNRPACLRQTVRKVVGPHSAWGPLRAGYSLLGASFFSYTDTELGFGDIDELIIDFGFYLGIDKLGT